LELDIASRDKEASRKPGHAELPRNGEIMLARLILALGVALAPVIPADAAGIDSRAYTCSDLHSLIAAYRFVFISAATFGDFVVAGPYYCGGGEIFEVRSVATRDLAECPVNYCRAYTSSEQN
jgi:hypothetical protein